VVNFKPIAGQTEGPEIGHAGISKSPTIIPRQPKLSDKSNDGTYAAGEVACPEIVITP
jgi:hypothetical protein